MAHMDPLFCSVGLAHAPAWLRFNIVREPDRLSHSRFADEETLLLSCFQSIRIQYLGHRLFSGLLEAYPATFRGGGEGITGTDFQL